MEINPKIHLTTGQFASLLDVSKDTLHYYDKAGIFSPELVASNGYRYYSIYQADVFIVIQILKELDMPLKEIKQFLTSRSPENLIHLLELKEQALTEKMNELKTMKQVVSDKLSDTKQALRANTYDVLTEHRPADEYIAVTHTKPLTNDLNIYQSMQLHYRYLEEHGIAPSASEGWMIHVDHVRGNAVEKYDYLYTRVKEQKQANHVITKGTYLIAYHNLGYSRIGDTYHRLLSYADQHQLTLSGYFYEDILLDELSVEGSEKYLVKISVKVIQYRDLLLNEEG
ncbi:MerR family transcriptional regulator [Jeotgalibacillus alimentarius]|uniref:MerR family transcriptional regulator n=1 Tax=Jeotgalibacillus alimentarius TaxID=135826 RepID=A0A0C2VE26_9BACL|nr:MerR family transcriptional regulator [Jeotgalibacillus alimentarius]KIL42811.1 MerR family transcriptional regulator [Jeotgalibacillus alimentarius]